MEQTGKTETSQNSGFTRILKNERLWIGVSIGLAVLILLAGLWSMLHVSTGELHTRRFKGTFKSYGSRARLALFFVLAHYVLKVFLQKRIVESWGLIKRWIIGLSRFARRWHVPIAVISIGLILLHVVGAFLYGFTFDFHNISGLLALIVLLPVPVSGLFRYRRLNRKWHLQVGLTFAVLFLIHAFI